MALQKHDINDMIVIERPMMRLSFGIQRTVCQSFLNATLITYYTIQEFMNEYFRDCVLVMMNCCECNDHLYGVRSFTTLTRWDQTTSLKVHSGFCFDHLEEKKS